MDKTYRESATEHLKQGNLCKAYADYIGNLSFSVVD